MGWRAQDAYDDTEHEREFVASLSRRDRLRLRIWQASGVGILACILALLVLWVTAARSTPIDPGQVTVIDGDTIRVGGEVYRLVGLNTPEPGLGAKCERERNLAARATFRLRQIVTGGGLDLERVPCACPAGTEGTQRCNFGRLCGSLKAAGRDVASILISEGLAEEYICSGTRCPKRRDWCT